MSAESFQPSVASTGADAPASKPASAPADSSRPSWLPEKFSDGEALATAYKELEQKLGAGGHAAGEPKQTAGTDTGASPSPAPSSSLSADTLKPYFAEYAEKGQLSDESYGKLAAAHGLDRSLVDDWIAGQTARAEMGTQRVYAVVGGEAEYQRIVAGVNEAIAAKRITTAQVNAYNALLDSGNIDAASLALRGIAAAMEPARPAGSQISGSRRGGGVTPFGDFREQVLAQKDPRYKTDPAYRRAVDERIAVS